MRENDRFVVEVNLRDALGLHLFFLDREDELSGPAAELAEAIRSFLYERLSIEEMERPEALLSRLGVGD